MAVPSVVDRHLRIKIMHGNGVNRIDKCTCVIAFGMYAKAVVRWTWLENNERPNESLVLTKRHDVLQTVSGLVSGRKMFYRIIVRIRRVGRTKIDDDSSENPDGSERKPNVRHEHVYTCRVQAAEKHVLTSCTVKITKL